MALREQLLEHLKPLSSSEFGQILFRLNMRASDLSGPETTQTQTAIRLIERLEQEELGLQRLQTLLNELDYFGDFLPEGAYSVGQKLREREEARERQAMEAAATRGEDPEDYRITPEKFYTFRPEAAWLGIFWDWDARRSFHTELAHRVVSASHSQNRCPAAAIIGPGGSGKSVVLRRLGIDLAEQGYKVWWAEEPERLLQFGMSQLVGSRNETCFLLIDDVQALKNEHEYIRRLQRAVQNKDSLVLVVAGRELPNALRGRAKPGDGLITLDETTDHAPILRRIGEIIPDWARKAERLTAEALHQARLIRLLLVLSRGEAAPADEQELETAFLEILADDIRRMRSVLPGLAEAVIDAAAIHDAGGRISRETLIALADYHQRSSSIPILLEEIDGNPRWQALSSLLSHSIGYGTWKFHHDELANGLLLAGQRGLLGNKPIGDDMWKKAVLDIVINRGSKYSKSYALIRFVRNFPGLISKDRTVTYIRQLLVSGNGHHAYLRLILDEALALDEREILDLLLLAAGVTPFSKRLWIPVSAWVKSHYPDRKQRAKVLEQVYQAGCRFTSVLNLLLRYLPAARANRLAKEWLRDKTTHPEVLCSCINLLGEEAKEDARRLLRDENTTPEVLCSCINLLREEAKEDARRLLRDENTTPEVLCSCINLLREEAKEDARRLLRGENTTPEVLCSCINLLREEAKEDARRLLRGENTHPEVLCSCINLLREEAKEDAKKLLKDENTTPEVLCSCINLLGEEAKEDAKRLLKEENMDHQVLCSCINLLGEEAKEDAKKLLKDENTTPEVLCSCVKLLGEDAKPFAVEQIRDWREANLALLMNCFRAAGATPEGQKATEEIFAVWDEKIPNELRIAALRAPLNTPVRTQRAREILEGWVRHYRPLVAAALSAFWNDPDAVTKYCKAILNRWHREIVYRRQHNLPEYDGYIIIKALSNPGLRREAHRAAMDMLSTEARSPGFLGTALLEQVENIAEGQWPLWSESDDEGNI